MSDAKFSHLQGISLAANGDVYITDLGNFHVRRIAGEPSRQRDVPTAISSLLLSLLFGGAVKRPDTP